MKSTAPTPRLASPGPAPKKPAPRYTSLWMALVFLLLHFTLWPLVWHGVLLPQSRPERHQLRAVSSNPYRVSQTALYLDEPGSSVSAYALWQVPKAGLFRIKLSCDDNGKVFIDGRPIITLEGVSANNVGETQKWLTSGRHFLGLGLNNSLGKGWLKVEVSGPGELREYSLEKNETLWSWVYPTESKPLSVTELSYLDSDHIELWLKAVYWGEYLCLLGFLGSTLLWLGKFYYLRRTGRLFPNLGWRIFFLALTVLTLVLSTLYHTEHPIPPIWSDGLGHYSYLPAYLIYHDLSLESIYSATRRYDYPDQGFNRLDLPLGEGFIRYPGIGRYIVKYPLGTAVLMLPFFLLGHLMAPLLGSRADGFSLVYQFAIAMAAIFYMLGGLLILFKILIRHFSAKVVTFTLLSLFLGTNLLAYTSVEPSYSHIYSFFLVCLLLVAVPRWYADPSRGNTLFLGAVAGLIILVRNPNAVFLLFFPLYGISSRETAKEKVLFLWQMKKRLLLFLAVVALIFFPQMVIWKIAANQFLISTQTNPFQKFFFLSPSILKVLFSFHHGLFLWAPILLFSVVGLWKMKGPLKDYSLPIGVCLLLHLYIVSSWYFWFYGGSFGHRAFVDTMGMFALPLACFFDSVHKTIVRRLVYGIGAFFIALTFYLFFQSFQGVLPSGMRPFITWGIYKNALGDTSGMVYLKEWLKKPQINYRLLR
jgi:hypothetical protein